MRFEYQFYQFIMATNGKLSLTVVEARLERDTETFGKMDPYVVVHNRMQRMRTATQEDAGKEPVWNETLELDVKYIGDDINIWVMDENVMTDACIGEASVKLSSLCVNGGLDDWWTITYKGKKAGMLHMKGDWQPTSSNALAAAAARKPGVLPTEPQKSNPNSVTYQQTYPQAMLQQPVTYVAPVVYQQQPQWMAPAYQQPQMVYQQGYMGQTLKVTTTTTTKTTYRDGQGFLK